MVTILQVGMKILWVAVEGKILEALWVSNLKLKKVFYEKFFFRFNDIGHYEHSKLC